MPYDFQAALNTLPLFAFGFVSPWLLWGLSAAAAPVLIHLLNKRKFKETQWAAMKFLLAAVRKNSRRIRIEQLLLLAARAMILILLVLALAQPVVEQLGAYFTANLPAHKILVIDASFSMGYQPAESTLFERAREAARAIVDDSGQGDAINLVRISNLPPAVIVETPAFQAADVIQEIDQLQLPHGRGDLLTCFARVADLLKAAPEIRRKEIYFISDFQRAGWSAESADDLARLRELLKTLEREAALILVDVGQAGADNMAVVEFSTLEPYVTIARDVQLKAVVHNYGAQRVTGQSLEFLVDGKLMEQRRVELNGFEDRAEVFSHKFLQGGEHRLQARLQRDALSIDDQRYLSVPVQERIRVLCVNGRNTGQTLGKATDYLELALSPDAHSGMGRALIEPRVINEGELQGLDLSKFDCVFVCNVGLMTPREAAIFESYLQGGGGVIWCMGDQVQADSYNQVLYQQGKGILPARLGDRRGDPEVRQSVYSFVSGDFAHPIINAFQGNPDAGLETTQTYAYVRAMVAAGSTARVALRFDTGDPAIVEMPVGAGKSILVTTSVSERWTNWPLWPSFVPMVQELVRFAGSGRAGERQQVVARPLTGTFPGGTVDAEVTVSRPDGQVQPATVTRADDLSQFSYEGTDLSGTYEVQIGPPVPHSSVFAVNVDSRESDLTKLEKEELSTGLLADIEFTYYTEWEDRVARSESAASPRGGLTRWLLYAALYLMFVEQLMAWRFTYGLWLLFPPAALLALARRAYR